MFNNIRRIFILLSIFSMSAAAWGTLYAQDAKKTYKARIVWEDVAGAGGYHVEIRTMSGAVVFNQETAKNEIYPRLPLGEYNMKITVLDKFKRIADSTPWAKISLQYTETPFFEKIEPSVAAAGSGEHDFLITGGNFNENVAVSAAEGSGISIIKTTRISEEEIRIRADVSKAVQGKHSFILANDDKKFLAKNILTLQPSLMQKDVSAMRIVSVSPSKIRLPGTSVKLKVKGNNFTNDSRVFIIYQGKEIQADVVFKSKELVEASFPTDSFSVGSCDLVLRQNSGSSEYKGISIEFFNGFGGWGGIALGAGYDSSVLFSGWSRLFKNSYRGFDIYLGKPFYGSDAQPNSFFAGWNYNLRYSKYYHKKSDESWKSDLLVIQNRLGLYLGYEFSFPFGIMVHLTPGIANSTLTVKSTSGLLKVKSNDFVLAAGLTGRYVFFNALFIDLGGDYEWTFYKGTDMKGVVVYSRVGILL